MNHRKIALRLAAAVLFAGLLAPWTATVRAAPAISTSAEAAALIDVASGRIIVSHNGGKRMRIASLTKIMTAIVAIERGNLSDIVKVSANAAGKEGSSIYLKVGEEMSLENLLYGLMLRSGNDAATAIAEHVGGSIEGFVYMMNETARLIGMSDTNFENPHGLDSDNHYSTADDMARLTAYALRNPVFRDIVKTKVKTAPNPNEDWDYRWMNKNRMLSIYEGADGVKTGYTKLAKRCLVSSATRNGQQLAAVTLNDPNDWLDHRKLLDYGFDHFPLGDIVRKGDRIERLPVVIGQTFSYPLGEEERGAVRKEAVLLDPGSVEYRLGERGKLVFRLGETEIGSVPLYAEGSPQLAAADKSAFRYRESERYESTRLKLWALGLRETVRRLFVLS